MSRLDRALKLFSAMEKLPDEYIRSAEETLAEAEAGISRPAKPMGVLRRFVNSGWGAAVISGTVAAAVLLFVVQMGRGGGGVSSDQMPSAPIGGALEESSSVSVGSSIEENTETVNYTLSTEYTVYGQGTMQITAIVAAKNPGEPVSLPGGWYLERVTEEGVEIVHVYYTEEASTAVPPDENSYASLMKNVLIDRTPLTEGVYNLHATKYDGEKYVSVAKCSFIVGCETPPPLATTDPNRMVVEGVFFWANGEPFVNLPSYGNPYPVHLAVENEAVDLSDLTSGDAVVLIMANRIEETYPCRGRLYEIRKTADGSMEDLPAWMIESLGEMGYTVTETAAPADFAIRLEVWINGRQRNILDTYEGYIQKDLVADGVSRQTYTPSYAEKCQLYYAVLALVENTDLDFSKPVTYDNYADNEISIDMSPLTCYSLQFTANGRILAISGDATAGECVDQSDEARYFMEAVRAVFRFYRNTDAYKSMPEANGGYE